MQPDCVSSFAKVISRENTLVNLIVLIGTRRTKYSVRTRTTISLLGGWYVLDLDREIAILRCWYLS